MKKRVFTSASEEKYYDKYTYNNTSSITYGRVELGDATNETSTVLKSYTGMLASSYFIYPWFNRGGHYSTGYNVGVFT